MVERAQVKLEAARVAQAVALNKEKVTAIIYILVLHSIACLIFCFRKIPSLTITVPHHDELTEDSVVYVYHCTIFSAALKA